MAKYCENIVRIGNAFRHAKRTTIATTIGKTCRGHYKKKRHEDHCRADAERLILPASASRDEWVHYKALYPTTADKRVWELFCLLAGCVPNGAHTQLTTEAKYFRQPGQKPLLAKGKIEKIIDHLKADGLAFVPLFHILVSNSRSNQTISTDRLKPLMKTIQVYRHAWETLAAKLGFHSIESLCMPYMMFSFRTYWYKLTPDKTYSNREKFNSLSTSHLFHTRAPPESIRDRNYDQHNFYREITQNYLSSFTELTVNTITKCGMVKIPPTLEKVILELKGKSNNLASYDREKNSVVLSTKTYPIRSDFPPHILVYLRSRFGIREGTKEDILKHMMKSKQNVLNEEGTLLYDAAHYNVVIKKSRAHGRGVFAKETRNAHTVVGCFWGTIVRQDLTGNSAVKGDTMIGHKGLEQSFRYFLRYSCRLGNQTKPVWIMPDRACVGAMFNHGRRDKANAKFVEAAGNYADLTSHKLITIRMIRRAKKGEEILVEYGEDYGWSQRNE